MTSKSVSKNMLTHEVDNYNSDAESYSHQDAQDILLKNRYVKNIRKTDRVYKKKHLYRRKNRVERQQLFDNKTNDYLYLNSDIDDVDLIDFIEFMMMYNDDDIFDEIV